MGGNEVALVIAALLGGTLLKTIFDFISTRITLRAQAKVADGTVKAQIETAELAGLMAKLVYLERVIENLSEYQKTLQDDRNAAEDRARRWETRVRELEEHQERLETEIRRLRIEPGSNDV